MSDQGIKKMVEDFVAGLTRLVEFGGFVGDTLLLERWSTILDWLDASDTEVEDWPEDLSDLVIAMYWALYDCHGGQYTMTYSLACRTSNHYRPGQGENGPEEGSSGNIYYEEACRLLVNK